MKPIAFFFGLLAGVTAALVPAAASAANPKVHLKMDTVGPPELEEAIKPYSSCLWRWAKTQSNNFHALIPQLDFANGPEFCSDEREVYLAAGDLALSKSVQEKSERQKLVRQQLRGANIEMLGTLAWMSQWDSQDQ
jgi:hypothetical protein